ncbi:MAG: 5-formyltetrahydrofolate cyclo-ligase [Bacteroidota bacterium]|nr:5-formyltetrahydrofolate cyclo-ligase [Bacteroidota bacterium]
MIKNPPLAAISNGNKAILRERYLTLRESISVKQLEKSSNKICDKLLNHFSFSKQNIHLFYPIEGKNEINTWSIHHKLKETCQLHTSIYNTSSNQWDCIRFESGSTFIKQRYNVPVPSTFEPAKWNKLDFILLPLLCFDDHGNRVGYGKGIYDQICKHLNASCIKIGISLFEAHPNSIEVEKHDIPLDYCQTPLKLYKFNF